MSPIRIVVLTILFYILFRLLIGAGRRKEGAGRSGTRSGNGGPARDVLMEDPVCHTLIPARKAFTLKKDSKIIYFCSKNCRSQFITKQPGEQK